MSDETELTDEERAEIATLEPEDERCKVGKCPYCGEIRNDLLPTHGKGSMYNLRCAECDSQYEWCSICHFEQGHDDHCRHIFQCDYGEWMGSGAYMDNRGLEYIHDTLRLLLDLMPAGFAQALRGAIASGRFHTWAMLPLIGGGGTLDLHGMPYRDNWPTGIWWGNYLMEIGSGTDAEETADAYYWLASLYDKRTRKANNITLRWLDQYISIERAARAWGRAA